MSRSQVRLYSKHPRSIPPSTLPRTVSNMEERRKLTADLVKYLERALSNLAPLNLKRMNDGWPCGSESARAIDDFFRKLFPKYNCLLWERGYTQSLQERGLENFHELLAQADRVELDPAQGRPHREPTLLFAWPRWESREALAELAAAMAPLAGRKDVALVLRHDPATDGDQAQALSQLMSIAQAAHGPGVGLPIQLEGSPTTPDLLPNIASRVAGILCAGSERTRLDPWPSAEGIPRLKNSQELSAWLDQLHRGTAAHPRNPSPARLSHGH